MSGIKMRIGISEEEAKRQQEAGAKQEEDSFLKKELKEKGVDLVVDKVMNMANITMPLPLLEVMFTAIKKLEKELENQLEQGASK